MFCTTPYLENYIISIKPPGLIWLLMSVIFHLESYTQHIYFFMEDCWSLPVTWEMDNLSKCSNQVFISFLHFMKLKDIVNSKIKLLFPTKRSHLVLMFFKIHLNVRLNSECRYSSTLAVEEFCQGLPDSCWVSSILCPSICCSFILQCSLSRFFMCFTMFLTYVVECTACAYDGGDRRNVHIQALTQAPPSPLESPKGTFNCHSSPAVTLVKMSLLVCQSPGVCVSFEQPGSQGYAGSPSSIIGTWTPLISSVS